MMLTHDSSTYSVSDLSRSKTFVTFIGSSLPFTVKPIVPERINKLKFKFSVSYGVSSQRKR